MRNIVIFINGDFTLLENGSQIRMAEQVDFARNNFSSTSVYSFIQHPSHPWTDTARQRFSNMFPNVELILENRPRHLRWATRVKNLALAVAPWAGSKIIRWTAPGGPPRYQAMKSKSESFVFLVNFVDGYTILNGFPFASVIDTHDVRFIKHAKRYDMPTYSWRVLGKMRSELAILSCTQAVIMISPIDRAIIEALLPPKTSIFLVPIFQEQHALGPTSLPYTHDLLFVGALNTFNISGITGFIRDNMDWIGRRSILLAGRVCDAPEVKQLASECSNLTLAGFVEDLAPVYASAKGVLSPVDGTGLKIKVIEGLKHGKPIFGSAHSRDALPAGSEACVFPLDRVHVESVLDNPEGLLLAEEAARAYYERLGEAGERGKFVECIEEMLSPSS